MMYLLLIQSIKNSYNTKIGEILGLYIKHIETVFPSRYIVKICSICGQQEKDKNNVITLVLNLVMDTCKGYKLVTTSIAYISKRCLTDITKWPKTV